MKHIIWLPSYPKSGNTWLRIIISSLFFSKDGKFENFDFLEIDKFDRFKYFEFIKKINTEDYDLIFNNKEFNEKSFLTYFKYSLQAQKNLYQKDNFLFFKTNNARTKIKDHYYTNETTTLGFIYLIRDPRDIIVSYSKHLNRDIDFTIDMLLNTQLHGKDKKDFSFPELLLGWENHYLSWKNFSKVPNLFLRYEDFLLDVESQINEIINYLYENFKIKISNKKEKIDNIIKYTRIENLRKLEKNIGFAETSSKSKSLFFRKGMSGQWKNILSKNQEKQIINKFSNTMNLFGYS